MPYDTTMQERAIARMIGDLEREKAREAALTIKYHDAFRAGASDHSRRRILDALSEQEERIADLSRQVAQARERMERAYGFTVDAMHRW